MTDEGIRALGDRYLAAQLNGDRQEALRLVLEEGLERGVAVPDLHLKVVQRAQRQIGTLWQENRITVAQEHLATAISQLVVSQLYRYLPRTRGNGRRVLVACAEGEQHEMGARIAADFLEMAGFDVHFLGANVPADSVAEMAAERRPGRRSVDLLVLSATTSICFPGLQATMRRVRELAPDLPIMVGGSAFAWSDGCAVPEGVVLGGSDAHALVDGARRVLGVHEVAA
jgi:methanogenic corrinoid protein MtbC1